MYGRVLGVTAAYHSTKLKALDDKVGQLWYVVGRELDRKDDRDLVNELTIARGTVLQSICSVTMAQLEEIRD
jgi:hypothetical protein